MLRKGGSIKKLLLLVVVVCSCIVMYEGYVIDYLDIIYRVAITNIMSSLSRPLYRTRVTHFPVK